MVKFVNFYDNRQYYNLDYITYIDAVSSPKRHTVGVGVAGSDFRHILRVCDSKEACELKAKYWLENLEKHAIEVERRMWTTEAGIGINTSNVRELFLWYWDSGEWLVTAMAKVLYQDFEQHTLFSAKEEKEAERYLNRLLNGNRHG